MELSHFSKPDDSAMTNDWSEWWVRAWEAPLVLLSKFAIVLVSRFIMVTALWAILLSFLFALIQFSLLYYYEDMLMHVLYHVSYHVLYITQYTSARNSKLSLLSAGGISHWERSACDLCVAPEGDSWHIPYFPHQSRWVKYHGYRLGEPPTSTVTDVIEGCLVLGSSYLVLLANSTPFDILFNLCIHLWPPVLPCY